MEFAVWMFKHAAAEQLSPAAASILEGCLQLLDDGGRLPPPGLPQLLPQLLQLLALLSLVKQPRLLSSRQLSVLWLHLLSASGAASTRAGDAASLSLRGFTYQAVGQLAQRQPQAFAGRTDIAARRAAGVG